MASLQSIEQLIAYYVNLLIIQYHNKPKAQATIAAVVRQIIASNILIDIRDGYSLDTAVGVQLDVIGKYVGIDRFYRGQVFDGFFSFIDYDEVASPPVDRIGFADYSDWDTKPGKWLLYSNIISQTLVLNDDDYRVILRLKIFQNYSNHSRQSIDEGMFKFFGLGVYANSIGNMEMWYFIGDAYSAIMTVAIQKQVLPRPMGVKLNYIIPHAYPFFGFGTYHGSSPLIEGFSDYDDYDTKDGETLRYSNLIPGY